MPNLVNYGINNLGNYYFTYDDGSYRYINMRRDGEIQSIYYFDNNSTPFFRMFGPNGCTWQEFNNDVRMIVDPEDVSEFVGLSPEGWREM